MGRLTAPCLLLAFFLLAAGPEPGRAEPAPGRLRVAGATVLPGDGPAFRADVLIEGGKIVAVGVELDAKDATRLDASGLVLVPGFVDARSALGVPDGERAAGRAAYRMADAVDPWDRAAEEALAHGVTTVAVEPGPSSTWGGRTAVLKLGRPARILSVDAGVFATVGVTRGRKVPDGLSVRGEWGNVVGTLGRARASLKSLERFRKAAAAHRRALVSWTVKVMAARKAKTEPPEAPKKPKRPRHDPDALALASLVKGRAPLRVEVHGVRNILGALEAARKAGIHLVLEGCTGIAEVADRIPESVSVVLAARRWGGSPEARPDPADAVALARHGVPFAIASFGPSGRRSRFLPDLAALCVRAGLTREQALRAITADAARACGLGDRVGRIAPGLEADLVCLDGDPLSSTTRVVWVMVGGRVVHGGDR